MLLGVLGRAVGPLYRVGVHGWDACKFFVGAWLTLPLVIVGVMREGMREATAFTTLFATGRRVVCGTDFVSGLCGFVSAYTGSISPHIEVLTETEVVVSMADRPWLRNPFRSIHAVALTNLAELASALAAMVFQQRTRGTRVILVGLRADFTAKARGTITARVADVNMPSRPGSHTVDMVVPLTNADGHQVAVVVASWRVSVADAAPSTVKAD